MQISELKNSQISSLNFMSGLHARYSPAGRVGGSIPPTPTQNYIFCKNLCRGVAQSAERLPKNEKIVGSNPITLTINYSIYYFVKLFVLVA